MLIRHKFLLLVVFTIPYLTIAQAKPKCLPTKSNKENISACASLAEQGDVKAQNTLGEIYYQTALENKGYHTKARMLFEKAANQGLAQAQYNLGSMYRDEFNNFPVALSWFEKAAAQGNLDAQSSIGYIYENGSGGKAPRFYFFDENGENDAPELTDLSDKFVPYESSFPIQSYPRAIFPLSEYGQGVEPDMAKAIEWYRKAADKGHALAQTNLAYFYLTGIGVKKDEKQAFELYQKAAKQNCVPALKSLAFMHMQGLGTKEDIHKAFTTLEKAYRLLPDDELWKIISRIENDKNYRKYSLKTTLKYQPEAHYGKSEYTTLSDEDFIFGQLNYLKSFYQLNVIKGDGIKNFYLRNRKTFSIILGETVGEVTSLKNRFLLKKAIQGYYSAMTSLSHYYKDEEQNIELAQQWRQYAIKMGEVTYKNFWPGYPDITE